MFYESELRQDLVSGDWIVIAPKRSLRPEELAKKTKRKKPSKRKCPFENPEKTGHLDPVLVIGKDGEEFADREAREFLNQRNSWALQVIPNKFPVMTHTKESVKKTSVGPYRIVEGVGHHEVIITRDHNKNFAQISEEDAFRVLRACQIRCKKLASEKCSAYVSLFHNWGPKAGASVYHPHYQVIGIPVVPPDVEHSLTGSRNFFHKNKECVHCVIINWEKQDGRRIIFENDEAIVFAPFVSREPFEIRIFPKKHLPCFQDTDEKILKSVAQTLQHGLMLMEKNLGDPDYNFFIHTVPVGCEKKYNHYHWHIEVMPKMNISAGFELSTGIEINTIDPDDAARILRGKK